MINFSSISKESFLGILLRIFLKIIPNNSIVFILQGKLKGKKWIKGSGVNGYWLGSYEPAQVKLFESEIKKGNVFFDIGANVGFYSLLAAEIVGSGGKIFSFEPSLENFNFLKKHIMINGYENIFPFQVAVSRKIGVSFFDEAFNRAQGKLAEKGKIKINTISIDEWIDSMKLPIPDVIKIDVEGAEALVLKGAEFTLKKYQPIIFLSIHGEQVKNDCFEILRNCGYNLETKNKLFIFD